MRIFNFGNSVISSNITQSNGINKVTINGKSIEVTGNNISIKNGKIYVDGKLYQEHEELRSKDYVIQNVTIQGNVGNIDCNGDVTVTGNVNGSIYCNGSTKIKGEHKGKVSCNGNVYID